MQQEVWHSNFNFLKLNHMETREEEFLKNLDEEPVSPEMMRDLLKLYNDDEDVYNSLLKYPNKVFMCNGEKCCKCWGPVVIIYFITSPYSWENLCGRAGNMKICSCCKRRLTIDIDVMN